MTTFSVVDPTTGERLADLEVPDAQRVRVTIADAVRAQRAWSGCGPTRRGQVLASWASAIEADGADLSLLESRSTGRPVRDVLAEAPATVARCRHWAGLAEHVSGQQVATEPDLLTYERRAPLGVVAAILGWRAMTSTIVDVVAAALACGDAVVAKPSVYASLSALRLAELAHAAGLPPGLFTVVTGPGETGSLLAGAPQVAGIQFRGSPSAGAKIAGLAAARPGTVVVGRPRRLLTIVFADADLAAAADAAVAGVFADPGRAVSGATRVLVQDAAVPAFVEHVGDRLAVCRLGDPGQPGTTIGPLPSRRHVARLARYTRAARADGARLLTGEEGAEGDCFAEPRVLLGGHVGDRWAAVEVTGPALAVLSFSSEAQASAVARDPRLDTASVWTQDLARILRLADELPGMAVLGNAGWRHRAVVPLGGRAQIDGLTRPQRVEISRAG